MKRVQGPGHEFSDLGTTTLSSADRNMLFYAQEGKLEDVQILVFSGANKNAQDPKTGNTILHFFAADMNLAGWKYCETAKVDGSIKNSAGQTAEDVFKAASKRKFDLAERKSGIKTGVQVD
jgi:hypothetical protein